MKQLRFNKNDKKQVNFYFSKVRYEEFKKRFPNMTSWFLSRCLERAIDEPNFFANVLTKKEI